MSKTILFSFFILLSILLLKNTGNIFPESERPKNNNHYIKNVISPIFNDETLDWQLYARHRQSGHKLTGLNEVLGSGVCVIDYDNDGWEDVFIVGGSGQHRFYGKSVWWSDSEGNTLWKNTGGKSFVNVSNKAKIPKTNWGMGCAVGDLDNDGDTDLLILNIGQNVLLENNGSGSFTDISEESGIGTDVSWSLSASMADYDNDGLLDIYIANFVHYEKAAKVFERASGFLDTSEASFDPILYSSQSNNLYKNTGGLKFVDKAASLEVADTTGRGKAVRWLDANNDKLPDLAVLNSGGSPNQLYINQGGGSSFKTNSSIYYVESAVGSHSAVAGDVDNDGDMDMIFSRPSGTPPMLLINSTASSEGQFYKSRITQGYTDLAWEMGLAKDEWLFQDGWGSVLKDFNNDGWLDLYIANGLAMIDPDSEHVTIGQNDSLWLNKNGYFEIAESIDSYKLPSRGAVSADFNNDGLMDLLVTQNNGFVRLLINRTKISNHWLGVVLVDEDKTEIGAKITLQTSNNEQIKQLYMDNGYLSQGTTRLHFGFPVSEYIVSLKIEWPDGTRQIFNDVKSDQYIVVNKATNTWTGLPIKDTHGEDEKSLYKFLDDENKKHYIALLSLIKGDERAADELMHALDDKNPIMRKKALNGLFSIKSARLLSAIHKSLFDQSEIVRLDAISMLKSLELERSVPWLITALSDASENVRCSAAKTFEFFFKEEEAVIFRKKLALPYLILMLRDEVPQVRVCAANALAESERYRAIAPLIKIIADSDVNVRNSAIRALGLLRDKGALDSLREVALSYQQPASVRAHALIALKRLNTNIAEEMLNNIFVQQRSIVKIESGIDIIDELSDIAESIVFDRKALNLYRDSLTKQACVLKGDKYCAGFKKNINNYVNKKILKSNTKVEVGIKSIKEIKESIYIVVDKVMDVKKRKSSLEYLVIEKPKVAKSLILKIIKDDVEPMVEVAVDQLNNYQDDGDVRELLWAILKNEKNTLKIRLMAAKNLALNEPKKVMSVLLELGSL